MPTNYTLKTTGTTIGGSGMAAFHQSGGRHEIAGDLVLADAKGSKGVYHQVGGNLRAQGEVIGHAGEAVFRQSGGTNTFDRMAIGNAETGTGTYWLEGTGVLHGGELTVGVKGNGTLAQTGGTVVVNSNESSGPSPYFEGTGTPATLNVAQQATATGTFALTRGQLYFQAGQYQPTLRVGVGGDATFQLGGTRSTPVISEGKLVKTNLVVRARPGATGVLRGWGDVLLTGSLINNDKVIADGFNMERTLDLSHFRKVENRIDNPTEGGTHGWIARRKGAIRLPPVRVRAGTGTYTWGESADDPVIDLVNSIRFTVRDATYPGEVDIALLSKDRSDIPHLPKLHNFIGVWSFDATDIDAAGGFDFTIRYDDHYAKSQGINESILKFWAFEPDGLWHRIRDDSFRRDIVNNLIRVHADDLTYFAISAPEPSSGILVLAGAATLTLARRRRKHTIRRTGAV